MNIRDCLVSRSLRLDTRDSILETRNSSDSNFETRGLSLKDRVETVNLPLSGTVVSVFNLSTLESIFNKCDLSRENVPNGIRSNGRTHGKRTDEKRVGKPFETDKANG